jgi:hypothetical protein
MKVVQALKAYFEADPHGRKVTMDELKALDKPERRELAEMCAAQLGVTLDADAAA